MVKEVLTFSHPDTTELTLHSNSKLRLHYIPDTRIPSLGAVFQNVKPCSRCMMPTVVPEKGVYFTPNSTPVLPLCP